MSECKHARIDGSCLFCELDKIRAQKEAADLVLFEALGTADDPEHVISLHAASLPDYFRRMCKAVVDARAALVHGDPEIG